MAKPKVKTVKRVKRKPVSPYVRRELYLNHEFDRRFTDYLKKRGIKNASRFIRFAVQKAMTTEVGNTYEEV